MQVAVLARALSTLILIPLVPAVVGSAHGRATARSLITPLQTQAPRSDTIVKIVTGPARPPIATVRVMATVGRADGAPEHIFGNIEAFALGKDLSIFVAEDQGSVANVRQFDSTGRYLRTFGRKGQGPGEFRSVDDIAIHPDGRVLVLDGSDRAINVFTAEGRYLTKWSLGDHGGFRKFFFFVNADGITHVAARQGPLVIRSTTPTRSMVLRLNSSGVIMDSLVAPPAPEPPMPSSRITGRRNTGQETSITIEFAPQFVSEISRLGYYITGRTDRYNLDLLLPTRSGNTTVPWKPGDPITSLRRNQPLTPFPEAERTLIRERIDRSMQNGTGWNWNGGEVPRNRPAFLFLITDNNGRIYSVGFDHNHRYTAEEFADFDDEATHMWEITEPDGRLIGAVRTEPRQIIIPTFGDNVLLFAFGTDVPQISRAKLIW